MQPMKKISKTLLRNVIRQTETHNRIVEEEDCWRQYETMRATSSVDRGCDSPPKQKNTSRLCQSLSNDSVPSRPIKCRAHMDDADEVRPEVYTGRDNETGHQNNFWLRQLVTAESSDPNRWGHSGYKELYPRDFETSASNINSDSESSGSSRHDRCAASGPARVDKNSASGPTRSVKRKKKSDKTKDRHAKKKKKKHGKKRSASASSAVSDHQRTESKKRKRKDSNESKKKKKKRKHNKNE